MILGAMIAFYTTCFETIRISFIGFTSTETSHILI